MDKSMICIIYAQGVSDLNMLIMKGKFKLCASEVEADQFIELKVRAGFTCHRFNHVKSFTRETNVVELRGVA